MFARSTFTVAVATAALVAAAGSASAADQQFCQGYAQAALNQVRGGLNNPPCIAGMQGPRWSAEYHVHYDWCIANSYQAAGTERDARTGYLKACTGQH